VRLAELLADTPPARSICGARQLIRNSLESSGAKLIVVDDDPTGTQTVHGVRVYLRCSPDVLRDAMVGPDTTSFLSVNTRALPESDTRDLARRLGGDLAVAAESSGKDIFMASRSDSTLRGHYPAEVDSLVEGLGWKVDGVIIAPAFFEAGRYTVGDVHWVEQRGRVVPAAETEFARDPSFGYSNSDLKDWVVEKTGGRVTASQVVSVPLDAIRLGGPEAVMEILLGANNGVPVIVNAACYEDLEAVVLGLIETELRGRRFIYRTAAPFVKVRAGIADRPCLTRDEIGCETGAGIVAVGSYVEKTSAQLDALLASGLATGVEISVEAVVDERRREDEIARAAAEASRLMASGVTPAVFTSRSILKSGEASFLSTGKLIMDALCDAVAGVETRPSFVLAKGGITSMEIARVSLGISGAEVIGQIREGVAVWRAGLESRWPGVPYVVFPGNVGDDYAVRDTVALLSRI